MRTLDGCGLGPHVLIYIEYTTIRATAATQHYKSYVLEVFAIRTEKYKEVHTWVVCSREGNFLECHATYTFQTITGLVCKCNISKYNFNRQETCLEIFWMQF